MGNGGGFDKCRLAESLKNQTLSRFSVGNFKHSDTLTWASDGVAKAYEFANVSKKSADDCNIFAVDKSSSVKNLH